MLEGKVAATSFMGDAVEYQIAVGDTVIKMKQHPFSLMRPGDTVRLCLPERSCRALLR